MSTYEKQYQLTKKQLLEKIAPLYAIFPWDDLYNDTLHGSIELDCLVEDAQKYATADNVKIIEAYNDAVRAESKISISSYSSDETWQNKILAAENILDKIDPFVEVILSYYEKTKK